MLENHTMRKRNRAFTLIELLVVISIIALLISILLPSLSAARAQAKSAVCLSNLKRLGTSTAIYLLDNNGRFFPMRMKKHPATGETYVNEYGRAKPRWQWFLSTGTGPVISPEPFEAPFGDGPSNGTTTMDNDYFLCPSLRGPYARDIRNGAYGYNYQYLGDSRLVSADGGEERFGNFPVAEFSIRSPAATVLIADSRGADKSHGKHSYSLDPPRLATEVGVEKFGPKSPNDGPIAHSPAEARHLDRANVAFVDSHAERMTLGHLGYAFDGGGTVIPVYPQGVGNPATPSASNKLWTGLGRDPMSRPNEAG